MINAQVRKQGGAAVMTIPAELMRLLHLKTGATVELNVSQGQLIARPIQGGVRKHYSLKELLKGITPKKTAQIKKNTEWFRSLSSVGRELT